jgi:hypothetical protein
MESLERTQELFRTAKSFATFHVNFDSKYGADSHCDKKDYGFCKDDRFSGIAIKLSFDSWAGYYGNSNCGTVFRAPDFAKKYLIDALNKHQREIFATVAELMRKDARSLVSEAQKELEEARTLLERIGEDST